MNTKPLIMDDTDATHADVERLKRANNVLRIALTKIEFISSFVGNGVEWRCPTCHGLASVGHASTCLIKHALEAE